MAQILRAQVAPIILILAGLFLSGCNDGSSTALGGSSATSSSGTAVPQGDPVISGSPAPSVSVGAAYEFHPTVTYTGGSTLTFSVINLPAWANFDTTTGTLAGTPGAANVGTFPQVSISVSDGAANAALPAFSITVSAASSAPAGGGLAISGAASTTVAAGAVYSFHPSTSGGASKLTFAIKNKPAWAAFEVSTGVLSGKPAAANVGTYAQISISVSDKVGSATLAPFSINVEAAPQNPVTLSWTAPSQNTNGTTMTDLAGYHIYYGSKSTALNRVVNVTGADTTDYVIASLESGTWYFAIAAYNNQKVESTLSSVVPVDL